MFALFVKGKTDSLCHRRSRHCLRLRSSAERSLSFVLGLAAPAKILSLALTERWGKNQNHSTEELKEYEGFVSSQFFPLS
jgi:hypothetical protein